MSPAQKLVVEAVHALHHSDTTWMVRACWEFYRMSPIRHDVFQRDDEAIGELFESREKALLREGK